MKFGLKEPVAKRGVGILRDIIAMSKTGEVLHHIPERLASIIERYDNIAIDPNFRQDIYNVLSSSIDLAETLVDPTFPAEQASQQISQQMQILSRFLLHLNQRPNRVGYSILIPKTQTLIGQYGTVEEAESQLANLSALGAIQHSMVVPVKITSQHVVQPTLSNTVRHTGRGATLHGPLPPGIIPSQPAPQRAVELVDEGETFWDAAQKQRDEVKATVLPPPLPQNTTNPAPPAVNMKPEAVQEKLRELEKEAEDLVREKPLPGAVQK